MVEHDTDKSMVTKLSGLTLESKTNFLPYDFARAENHLINFGIDTSFVNDAHYSSHVPSIHETVMHVRDYVYKFTSNNRVEGLICSVEVTHII